MQLNGWTGGGIDTTPIDWCLFFVIVCQRGKHNGFEDWNLQTGPVQIDRLALATNTTGANPMSIANMANAGVVSVLDSREISASC